MYEVARWAVMVALLASAGSIYACVRSRGQEQGRWWRRARVLAWVVLAALFLATVILTAGLVARDFRARYVVHYTDKRMSWIYALSALWAGPGGSLLFWTLLLSALDVLMLWTARRRGPQGQVQKVAVTIAAHGVLAVLIAFFTAMVLYYADPFLTYRFPPTDGFGLKHQLQTVQMFLHPITLYLGYLGFAPAYALVIGSALVGGSMREALRRTWAWLLWGWTFLALGNILGMQWAYVVLGWGGYWAWDPVENASLIPWLVATGLLHVLVLVRRGALRPAVAPLLVVITFALSLLGVALTRGGIIVSVHTFAPGPLALPLAVAAVASAVLPLALLLVLQLVQRRRGPPSPGGRRLRGIEWGVAVTAVATLGLGAVVLGASWWPMIQGLLGRLAHPPGGELTTMGRGFYDRVTLAVGVVLVGALWVCGVQLLRGRAAKWAPVALVPGGLVAWYFLQGREVGAGRWVAALVLGAVAVGTVLLMAGFLVWSWEAGSGGSSGARRPWRRRCILGVHLGMAAFLGALVFSEALSQTARVVVSPRQSAQALGLTLRLEGSSFQERPTHYAYVARVRVEGPGVEATVLRPERRAYDDHDAACSELGIKTTMREDTVLIIDALDTEGQVALLVKRKPGVLWLWIGGGAMVLAGAGLAAWRGRPGSDEGARDEG